MTDAENRPLAYYIYFMEFADRESMVLDAMIGTPFSLDGKLIRTVADADDLAQMFYASGYEVVGTSLVDNSLSLLVNGSALATVSNFKLANVDDGALLYKAPMLRAAAVGAVASISGPFYDLNDMTVELFISNNYMMNEVRMAQMSSDLEISNVLTNNSSQKACVVAQYIRERSTEIVDSDSESSIESIVALDLIVGTPFMTKDNRIAVITDLSTLADFFESAGVVVKDNRAVYCTYSENANGVMMTASLNGMKAQLAYEILAQKNCTSRCISLEDIENAIAEKIAEKEKKAAESQTTDVAAEEQAAEAVAEEQAAEAVAEEQAAAAGRDYVFISSSNDLREYLYKCGDESLMDSLKYVTYCVNDEEDGSMNINEMNDAVRFLTSVGYGVYGDGTMILICGYDDDGYIIAEVKDLESLSSGEFADGEWAELSKGIFIHMENCDADMSIYKCFEGTGIIFNGYAAIVSDEDMCCWFLEEYGVGVPDVNGNGYVDIEDINTVTVGELLSSMVVTEEVDMENVEA